MTQFLQDLPSFCNPTVASIGCYQSASTTQRLKFPDGFPKTSESRVLKAAQRKVLRNSDLSVNFRAFEEAQSLGVLHNNTTQMDRLKKTEAAELLAAFKSVPRIDDMLPERKVAVTVLLHNSPKGNFDLLDAAAFLARTPDQRGRRAVQDVRFFFLAGEAATAFVSSHRTAPDASAEIKSVMGKRGEPISEVCVSWVDRFDAETGWARTQNSFCEIEYQTDSPSSDGNKSSSSAADKYVNAIRKAIAKAADRGGCKPKLGRILGFYPDMGHYSVNGAYERACIETSDDFFEILHGTPVCKLSEYCTMDDDFNGELEHTNVWVRLIPNFPKESSPTSEACTSGMLLHQKGFEEQAKEFCASIQIEERKKDPNRTIYGLRLPKQDELSIAPHVLFVSARAVTMHAQVTAYSLAQNVVGKSLYRCHGNGPQERWGTMVYSLQRQLVPLDVSLLGRMFVCPCREESCAFPKRDEYAVLSANFFSTIYNAKEQSFKNVFDSGFKLKKKRVPEHGSEESSDDDGGGSGEQTPECKQAAKKRRIVPTEEESVLLKALHFDLLYPALSLGEAHAEMARINGPEEFSQFLLAVANQTSLETSLLDGCNTATEILRNFAEYKKTTDMKLCELQTQLENAASNRSTSSSSLDTLATAPADAPVEEKLTLNGLELLRKLLGLAYTVALQLPQEMDEAAAAALLKKVGLALGVKVKEVFSAEQRDDLTGQLVRLAGFPFLRSIAAVASATLQHAKDVDGIVMACSSSDGLSLYVCKADGQATPMTPVSLLNTDVSRLAFVLFNEAQRTVTTLRKRE